jgi:hypothetical protein
MLLKFPCAVRVQFWYTHYKLWILLTKNLNLLDKMDIKLLQIHWG